MATTCWNALLHLNHACAVAASRMMRDGRTLEFSAQLHGEQEILINATVSRQIRNALQSGVELLADVPFATEVTTAWRDDDCRREMERMVAVVESLCAELQSRHDSLRDGQGAHAGPIEACDCDMSRLHRITVNAIELTRPLLLT